MQTDNNRTGAGNVRSDHLLAGRFFSFACALAVRVSVEVAVPLAGTDIVDGLNEHETRPVLLEHQRLAVPSNPLTGEIVTVKFADPPAFTLAVVGLTDPVKSQTCSSAEAVCTIGELVPVIVSG